MSKIFGNHVVFSLDIYIHIDYRWNFEVFPVRSVMWSKIFKTNVEVLTRTPSITIWFVSHDFFGQCFVIRRKPVLYHHSLVL